MFLKSLSERSTTATRPPEIFFAAICSAAVLFFLRTNIHQFSTVALLRSHCLVLSLRHLLTSENDQPGSYQYCYHSRYLLFPKIPYVQNAHAVILGKIGYILFAAGDPGFGNGVCQGVWEMEISNGAQGELVSWSLTSLFSINAAISETRGQGWRVILSQ